MRVSVIPRYLIGSRSAILELASSRMTILYAILFVISAAFAREYDGEDFLHEPWHILRPLGASLIVGTILFVPIQIVSKLRSKEDIQRPNLETAYLTFMGLFWMAAPMAWLYAIPYERMMSPVDAVAMNLWTLSIVALWRVLLITRVISVVYGVRAWPVFFIVMFFANTIAFILLNTIPLPVINLMGGVRHSPSDMLIATTATNLLILTVLGAPIWFVGSLIGIAFVKPKWTGFISNPAPPKSRALLITAIISIVVWLPIMYFTQPEQINRHIAERLLRSDRVAEAFVIISSKERDDYPPHWNPPPRVGMETEPNVSAIIKAVHTHTPPDWLLQIYLEKVRIDLKYNLYDHVYSDDWNTIVSNLIMNKMLVEAGKENKESVAFLLKYDKTLTPEDRSALNRLFEAGLPDETNL